MTDTIKLNCLILGDKPPTDYVFTVPTEKTNNVDELKGLIKDKKHRFDHIDAGSLRLWKVSIPLANRKKVAKRMAALEVQIPALAEKFQNDDDGDDGDDDDDDDDVPLQIDGGIYIQLLKPFKKLSKYYKEDDPPADEHLHIIVQPPAQTLVTPPGTGFLQGTPRLPLVNPQGPATHSDAIGSHIFNHSPQKLPLGSLGQYVETKLKKLVEPMGRYTRGLSTLPKWKPASMSLNFSIPTVGKTPELLLHDLGKWVERDDIKPRVNEIFGSESLTLLVNTSGSGKTRLLFEGLCKHWGLYFSCRKQSPTSGDLEHVLNALDYRTDLQQEVPLQDSTGALHSNRRIAERYFYCLLCARLLVFDLYLELVGDVRQITDTHKRRWLLLQVASERLGFPKDIFLDVMITLRQGADADLHDLAKSKWESIRHRLRNSPITIVIDEAQVAANMLRRAFLSSDRNSHRPILRELLMVWTNLELEGSRFVVSGTGLSISAVKDAASSVSAKKDPLSIVKTLGSFDQKDAQTHYIMSYLWPTVKNPANLSGDHQLLLDRSWKWLRGRFRFTASFVEVLLQRGLENANQTLNEFVHKVTRGFDISDYPSTLPRTLEDIRYEPLLPLEVADKLLQDGPAMAILRNALKNFLVRGTMDVISEDVAQLVEFGVARFKGGNITLDEPLALCAVAKLFEGSEAHSLYQYIIESYQTGRSASSRALVVEEMVAFELRRKFGDEGGAQLEDVFNFTMPAPEWATQRAKLVALYDGRFVNATLGSASSPRIGYDASTPEMVMSWFLNANRTPFLYPDNNMGPDLLFVLKLENGNHILVAVQVKALSSPTLSGKDLVNAIKTVSPNHFYKNKDGVPFSNQSRPLLIEQIQESMKRFFKSSSPVTYNFLRVIASYPSTILLSIEKGKVDDSHPLAILKPEVVPSSTPFGAIVAGTKRTLDTMVMGTDQEVDKKKGVAPVQPRQRKRQKRKNKK